MTVINTYYMWLLGAVGFIGFEGLRLYKTVLKSRSAVPQNRYGIYCVAVFLLLIFSGFAADIMASGNKLTALFVGFSVPTGMKAIFDDQNTRNIAGAEPVRVEDTKIDTVSTVRGALLWVKAYFS